MKECNILQLFFHILIFHTRPVILVLLFNLYINIIIKKGRFSKSFLKGIIDEKNNL